MNIPLLIIMCVAEVVCKTSVLLIYRPRNRSDDVVLALTTTGTVKVWTLTGEEGSGAGNNEPILENESKQIRCLGAVSMTCCVYNMRTVRKAKIASKQLNRLFFWTFFGNDLQLRIGETLSFSKNS